MESWKTEEDIILAEIILRHIREKSTALNAFDEASKMLNKDAASCAYRWNSQVRLNYTDAIEHAKKLRN